MGMDQGHSCWNAVMRQKGKSIFLLIFDHNDVYPQKCIAINTCAVPLSSLALTMIEVVKISAKIWNREPSFQNIT